MYVGLMKDAMEDKEREGMKPALLPPATPPLTPLLGNTHPAPFPKVDAPAYEVGRHVHPIPRLLIACARKCFGLGPVRITCFTARVPPPPQQTPSVFCRIWSTVLTRA